MREALQTVSMESPDPRRRRISLAQSCIVYSVLRVIPWLIRLRLSLNPLAGPRQDHARCLYAGQGVMDGFEVCLALQVQQRILAIFPHGQLLCQAAHQLVKAAYPRGDIGQGDHGTFPRCTGWDSVSVHAISKKAKSSRS
jgi:hypothetical protein